MGAVLTYPTRGRGAWPAVGTGGTLSADGSKPGRYYRNPTAGLLMPGLAAYRADRNSAPVGIDEYAVWRAALAVQTELRVLNYAGAHGKPLVLDGLWGANTDTAVRSFQRNRGLVDDGVFGPATARALWAPEVMHHAAAADPANTPHITRIMTGTIAWESGWDPGAVGSDPHDLGLGQINGPAHPKLSAHDRLNPRMALAYIARLIATNLRAFDNQIEDAIAAYNLGQGGARAWIKAGRTQQWQPAGSSKPRDVHAYIDRILNPR